MSRSELRKAETRLQTTLAAVDVLAVLVATVLAYGVRFHSVFTVVVPVTKGVPPLTDYLAAGLVIAAIWVPLFAALGLYRPRHRLDFPSQFDLAVRGIGFGLVVVLALTFFYRGASFSRLVLPMAALLVLLLVPLLRVWIGGAVARRVMPPSGVAVAGSGPTARELAARLAQQAMPGTRFVGLFADTSGGDATASDATASDATASDADPARSLTGEHAATLRVGTLDEVLPAARLGSVHRVYVALRPEESSRTGQLVEALAAADVHVDWVPVLPELHAGRLRVESVEGLPVIALGEFPLLGWNAVVKRAMDLGLSAAGLVGLAPLFALLAVTVRLSGPGPVIYRQQRIGRDGRRFQMLKFRSMRADAEAECGPVRTRRDDPRTTAVGRLLRRTSLDELPQLWNVLRGEMSLVGPRPERPELIGELVGEIPDYLRRHRVKAGMTGWAQVHGLRGAETSMQARVLCDLYYIENWSVWLDLRILLRTVLGIFREPNAF
ncbi:MAG: undecaprenyl-phosphate glucose phosphotransferase [Candidatus Eiseniibacteriota bacterium]|jgi:exopolysaccharide biosynthesis polyprenyl glycosylphosphotransferase